MIHRGYEFIEIMNKMQIMTLILDQQKSIKRIFTIKQLRSARDRTSKLLTKTC